MPSAHEVDVLGVFLFAGKEQNLLRCLVGFPHVSVERESVLHLHTCMAGSALFFFYNERVSKKALVLAGVAAGWGLRGLLEHQGLVGFQIRRT
jgi:hypothetical protein